MSYTQRALTRLFTERLRKIGIEGQAGRRLASRAVELLHRRAALAGLGRQRLPQAVQPLADRVDEDRLGGVKTT
jgi:hypothetical protein